MDYEIDPTLSVYALVERTQKDQRTTSLFNRRTMNVISNEIENATKIDGARNRIFSGFQYFSKFAPQAASYEKVAARAESVYLFGVMDVDPAALPVIENLHYIPLQPTDQLAREWFIISYSRTFATVLATEETSPLDAPDRVREFKGLWSFDVGMTNIVQDWLTSTVGAQGLMIDEDAHDRKTQQLIINNIMRRMTDRITRRKGNASMVETQEQLRIVIDNTLRPAAV